jgi:hypothetical protein
MGSESGGFGERSEFLGNRKRHQIIKSLSVPEPPKRSSISKPDGRPNTLQVASMQEPMNEAVRKATEAFALGQTLMNDITRYATPPPLANDIQPIQPLQPCPFSRVTMTWARHFNARLIGYIRSMGKFPLRAVLLLPNGEGEHIGYMTPFVHGWVGQLLECEVTEFTAGRSVKPRRPFRYKQSLYVLAEAYTAKDKALPFLAWDLSPDNTLQEEHILGSLGDWKPTRAPRLAIADGDVGDDAVEVHDPDADEDHPEDSVEDIGPGHVEGRRIQRIQ